MQGFKSVGSARRLLSFHAAPHDTFNVQRHLISAGTHRAFRTSVACGRRRGVSIVVNETIRVRVTMPSNHLFDAEPHQFRKLHRNR
jgi:hypothetical protein